VVQVGVGIFLERVGEKLKAVEVRRKSIPFPLSIVDAVLEE
jgi:hypothetical protein